MIFGLIKRVDIRGRDGATPYLTRWLFPRTRRGRLMLHKFHRGDEDRECHDHPWDFYTYPLNHGYFEEELDLGTGLRSIGYVPRRRWSFKPAEHSHRLLGPILGRQDEFGPHFTFPLWTLVWAKDRRRERGFWCRPELAYSIARRCDDLRGWIVDKFDRPKWVHVNWRRYVFCRDQGEEAHGRDRHEGDATARGW